MALYADGPDLLRRLVVARALAAEHGTPLAWFDEEDQLDWDRKAVAILRDLDALVGAEHGMIAGSHERPGGPECRCGAAWLYFEDRCATASSQTEPTA